MPLLDHFRPPLHPKRPWDTCHATWTVCLAEALNKRWLPAGYYANVQTHAQAVEIDVATYEQEQASATGSSGSTALATAPAWSPPVATLSLPAIFPESFEVRVMSEESSAPLVAAIEMISPGNKDRPAARRQFAIKCAAYLNQGVSLIIVDVVTTRKANLHREIMRVMEADESYYLRDLAAQYAVAYRPVLRESKEEIDLWSASLAVGAELPVLPMRLTGDLFVPVDFEDTYMDACRRMNLIA